ncbi:extracellular solute-binding family 1 domain protein [Burkholderia mallei]|nr:extracellular solute-binding family 1 domain protein [Burkholderia mallei]
MRRHADPRRVARAVARRIRRARARHRDLLQLPARMGRLGRADRRDQAADRHSRAVRQQELGPGDRATDRRAEEPRRGRRLSRRVLGVPGEGQGRRRPLQARALERHPGESQGPARLLVRDPLRHARLLRQQGRARRQAGAAHVGRSAQARVQGDGRLSRSVERVRRLCGRRRGEPGARRQLRRFPPGARLVPQAEGEPADRAEADRIRARAVRRDSDPARLRFRRLSREVQGSCERRIRDSEGRHDLGAVRDEPREGRAARGERQEGARFRAVRRRPEAVGERVSAAGARAGARRRRRRAVPAGERVRAREERRLRQARGRPAGVRQAVSASDAITAAASGATGGRSSFVAHHPSPVTRKSRSHDVRSHAPVALAHRASRARARRVRRVLAVADGLARAGVGGRRVRRRLSRAAVERALHEKPRIDGRAVRGRHARDARAVDDRGPLARAPRIRGQARADRAPHVSARVPGRRRRLHGDHARRPPGLDRHAVAKARRRSLGVRVFGFGPVRRLSVLLDSARDRHGDRRGVEARSVARGGRALARRVALARAARHRAARARAGPRRRGRDLLRDRDGRVRHRVHAGDRSRRAADDDLHRVHAEREHRDGGRSVDRTRHRHVGCAGARAEPDGPGDGRIRVRKTQRPKNRRHCEGRGRGRPVDAGRCGPMWVGPVRPPSRFDQGLDRARSGRDARPARLGRLAGSTCAGPTRRGREPRAGHGPRVAPAATSSSTTTFPSDSSTSCSR